MVPARHASITMLSLVMVNVSVLITWLPTEIIVSATLLLFSSITFASAHLHIRNRELLASAQLRLLNTRASVITAISSIVLCVNKMVFVPTAWLLFLLLALELNAYVQITLSQWLIQLARAQLKQPSSTTIASLATWHNAPNVKQTTPAILALLHSKLMQQQTPANARQHS